MCCRGFAAAGWQLWKACEAADAANRQKDAALAALDQRVAHRTAELTAANAQLARAVAEVTAHERARTQWVTALVSAQEDERRRVARELHDETGQHIVALMLGLESLRTDTANQSDVVSRLKRLVSDLDLGVRRLARDLRPTALDDLGLTAALEHHLSEWSQQTGIAAEFSSRISDARLATSVETTVYRVVQEALTNIARHSEALAASVVLERRGQSVVVIIEDDGHGFEGATGVQPDPLRRLGLTGIRERAGLLGGTAVVESSAAHGTSVFVTLPIEGRPHA